MRKAIPVLAVCLAGLAVAAAEEAVLSEPTVITSKTLTLDYKRSIAVFEQDVVVVDPEIRMEADRLNVFFDGTNDVKAVTAVGNVRMWHEDKQASCNKAVYTARTGQVIMQGDARVVRGPDVISGNEITFSFYEDQITCNPGHVVFYPKQNRAASLMVPGRKPKAKNP